MVCLVNMQDEVPALPSSLLTVSEKKHPKAPDADLLLCQETVGNITQGYLSSWHLTSPFLLLRRWQQTLLTKGPAGQQVMGTSNDFHYTVASHTLCSEAPHFLFALNTKD